MEALMLTVFVSISLVAAGLLFFAWNVHAGSHEHSERLALLPLEDDAQRAEPSSTRKGRN
jgi:cbb3-type cytochrome oxidase maturation protein